VLNAWVARLCPSLIGLANTGAAVLGPPLEFSELGADSLSAGLRTASLRTVRPAGPYP
jgi:hypothetical protein